MSQPAARPDSYYSDACVVCGAYGLALEELNGKLYCEECADELPF